MTTGIRWFAEATHPRIDPNIGAEVVQFTSSAFISFNVYCEQVYASVDGSRFAFVRVPTTDYSAGPFEVWVCDLTTRRVARVDTAANTYMATTPFLDTVYYARPAHGGEHVLVRLNLATLEREEVFRLGDCPVPCACAISPDEHWFLSAMHLHDNVFGIYRVDLSRGKWEVIHEHADISNTHVQVEPVLGRDVMIQNNGGSDLGTALYLIDIDGKNERPLPVGRPHTADITGHQCWIGKTGKILCTIDDTKPRGGQCVITPGEAEAKVFARGFALIHISASADGRFFVADQGGDHRVYFGSLETGRVITICETEVSWGAQHYTHPHPYLTPDNKHVIFNSDRTGVAQVYAAVVPEHAFAYVTERI